MRLPSFYAEQYRHLGTLNETPFGTNFLVEPLEVSSGEETSSPAPGTPQEQEDTRAVDAPKDLALPKPCVLLPLEITSSTLPFEQLKQELQALTRLKHAGILAPLALIERTHHHTQHKAMALIRAYVPGEPFLRFASLATLPFDESSDAPDSEDVEEAAELDEISAPSLISATDHMLNKLSEDTDEVSLIISEVSRSDRYEGIAPLATRLHRLARVLPELLDALAHLHRYKRYHGALSPDCIFIDSTHHARIADAGLWHIMRGERHEDDSSVPPGALHAELRLRKVNLYRAPEMFLGGQASSASDLYSLGCLLFHALCGEPPFSADTSHELAHRHIHAARPELLERQPHCPSSWVRMIHQLMRVEPAQRPTIEALQALVSHLPTKTMGLVVPTQPRATSFCGRPEIIERLEQHAMESRESRVIHPIVLRGGPGQGKHYFVDHLIDRLTRRGWLVLRGRCYANAFDPYRGWRYLIDDLVALLEQAPRELLTMLDSNRRIAATLFPSLHPEPHARETKLQAEENTSVQRLDATLALRAIFDVLSHQRPLLVVFDDLHLGTRDTVELLHDVLANDTPFQGMILVTSAPGKTPIFPEREDDAHTHLMIPALTQEESRDLLQSLGNAETIPLISPFMAYPSTHAPQLIKELVHEFQHTPAEAREALTKELLAILKGPAPSTQKLLKHVLERRHHKFTDDLSLNIMNILSLYAGPLSLEVLTHTLEQMMMPVPHAKTRDGALTHLATLRLIRRVSMGRHALTAYRITGELCRTLVLDHIDAEQLMLTHSAISKALTLDPMASTTQIFEHARRANRISEAQKLADQARLEACAQLAFSRAAEIQSWLVSQREEIDEEQRQELAELETASGQHKEAALLWQKMAEEQSDAMERIAALCEASEAWFYAGNFVQAAAMQEQALDFFGQHYAPTVAQNRWNRLKLWWSKHVGRRPMMLTMKEPLTGQEALRARVYILLLQTAPMLNASQAPTFERRLRRLALTHGAPRELAHAYLYHAQLLVELDLRRSKTLAQTHLEYALQMFAREGDFAKQSEVHVTQAHLAQSQGNWDRARALYSSAEELWRASSATTRMARVELDYQRGLLALTQSNLDEVARMIESLFYEERHLAPAQIRGHQLATHKALWSGNLQDAAAHMHDIEKMLPTPGTSLVGVWHLEQTANLHIARGEPDVALGRLELARAMYDKIPLHHMPRVHARIDLKTAQALCALLTRDFYTDRSRRGELFKRTHTLIRRLRKHVAQLTTVEQAALERLRMRYLWLTGRPRKALKILDVLDEAPMNTMGKSAMMVQREVRGMLLQATEHPDGDNYLSEVHLAYEAHAFYAPLVQEGWPFLSTADDLQKDSGA